MWMCNISIKQMLKPGSAGKKLLILCASICGTTVKPQRKEATNRQVSLFRVSLELLFVKGANPLSFYIFCC